MLICDLAETYQILNYRSLPARTVAALVAGLRDDSRLKMKAEDVKASRDTILLATIADRLGAIMAWLMGIERPPLFVKDLLGDSYMQQDKDNNDIVVYDSPEEFIRARYGE